MESEHRTADASGGRRPRGWVSLYAVAFALLVGAGATIGASAVSLLESTRLLWASTVLSGLAIVMAIVSVLLPRR
jgi:predicted MFS family arabinose efflux permease